MRFIATAKNGILDFGSDYNNIRLMEFLRKHEGKKFAVEMIKTKRSLSQNNFYHLYLGVIEQETGNSSNDLHEYFKRALLPPKFITVLGKEIKIPSSTTELSKIEFGEYLDKIVAMTNVPLPDPELAGFFVERIYKINK